jgi:hypothetical protein
LEHIPLFNNKKKNNTFHTVGKVPRSVRKIVERDKIDIENLWR